MDLILGVAGSDSATAGQLNSASAITGATHQPNLNHQQHHAANHHHNHNHNNHHHQHHHHLQDQRLQDRLIDSQHGASATAATLSSSASSLASQHQAPAGLNLNSHINILNSLASEYIHSPTGDTADQFDLPTLGATTATTSSDLMGHDHGPILYNEPNRTSAIDDLRSLVIYFFIVAIFLCFFLILPGIRNEKFPTFLCVTTSLVVTSIILISLFGTTWHVGEAPIAAAYKAFSRDRIQGELNVNIGLQSVNITLKAHRYYILHDTDGPIIMDNTSPLTNSMLSFASLLSSSINPTKSSAANQHQQQQHSPSKETQLSELENSILASSPRSIASATAAGGLLKSEETENKQQVGLGDELLDGTTRDGVSVDTELENEEVFPENSAAPTRRRQLKRSSSQSNSSSTGEGPPTNSSKSTKERKTITAKRSATEETQDLSSSSTFSTQKYTLKRVPVDINYNERFYWIEPTQMRHEFHKALERGLPYPILTVVEYLSQDDAGFNWSRQYRAAGYYASILLWLSLCVCVLMFCLHCAAPKHGIYMMQILGCLLLFTSFTYYMLVPKGDQRLVIPFEGQNLTLRFGWNFWLVLFGGCLSIVIGSMIVLIDIIFPNYIFTTVLDVDFDHNVYYRRKKRRADCANGETDNHSNRINYRRPSLPEHMKKMNSRKQSASEGESSQSDGHSENEGDNQTKSSRSTVSEVSTVANSSGRTSSASSARIFAEEHPNNSERSQDSYQLNIADIVEIQTQKESNGQTRDLAAGTGANQGDIINREIRSADGGHQLLPRAASKGLQYRARRGNQGSGGHGDQQNVRL